MNDDRAEALSVLVAADQAHDTYVQFLQAKVATAPAFGFDVARSDVNPALKPHQIDAVIWALRGGRRALFESFGLGKTVQELEIARLILARESGRALIVCSLSVRAEFMRDAVQLLGWAEPPRFIRRIEEAGDTGVYLTNYETVRDGKLDTAYFTVVILDEAQILRGFGGSKTFREFMAICAGDRKGMAERTRTGGVKYRFVATATPSPNEYIELLAYSAFLGIMEVSQAKTRFFKRDSTKADKLTVHPHKVAEWWAWVSSWALFLQTPSDLGHSDEGYSLPELDVRWHEIPSDHSTAGADRDGQGRMFKSPAIGVQDASREKRDSLDARIAKLLELRAEDPEAHRIIWHDLEAEREALERAIPGIATVYGTQDLELREQTVADFADGKIAELGAKPVMLGSGCNLQRHCHWAVFLGIGFKFADFIQAIHRIHRFLQTRRVRIDLIHTEAERGVRHELERKWAQHVSMVATMSGLIREFGLADAARSLTRSMDVERREVVTEHYVLVNNDCVDETRRMDANSVGLILTSIPFSTQYEYSPSYRDFGHTDNNDHFFRQMDFLTPELLRILQPGRIAAIHVKDRIVPMGMTDMGCQVVYPFHAKCIEHYTRHGFAYMGMKTIVTDVVRENNQTYRLGWTEQCKDGTKMGCGMPEYLLLFRKPQTDTVNAYADCPVVKDKPLCDDHGTPAPFDKVTNWKKPVPGTGYSRARWQFDAHGFARSSGNRLLSSAELLNLPHEQLYKLWRERSQDGVYNFEAHVDVAEVLDHMQRLPASFMLLPPHSWHPDVWTDITRMRTLNADQYQQGKEMHLCLARDSRVLTKERGYLAIQDVTVGHHVLTHMGRWRKVLIARCTGVQPCVTVRAHGVPGLTLTPDHKLWARKSEWVRARDGAEYVDPAWIEAQHSLGAYVNLRTPAEEPTATDDALHWWIVGRWLADGHWDGRGSAIISCGAHEIDGLKARLGDRAGACHFPGTAYQIRVLDRTGCLKEVLHRCGHGASGKHLPPEAFTLPTVQARALIEGYLSGDGHFMEDRQRWQVTAVSRDLLLGMALLAQRAFDAVASVYAGRAARESEIQGRKVNCMQEWVFCFDLPTAERRKQQFILSDGAWKKVRAIEDAGETETWCLRVEDDESFTAEGCIVKNCPMQHDIAERVIRQLSNPRDLVFDPFAGIGTVPYNAIKLGRRGAGVELSERYYADAVAYCQAAVQKVSIVDMFATLEAEDKAA